MLQILRQGLLMVVLVDGSLLMVDDSVRTVVPKKKKYTN